MSANLSRGRGRGVGGDSGGQRTCPLSSCENPIRGRFNYCSKEHAREAVANGEVEGCERCKTYPKNPGYEYCTRACGSMAAAGIPYGGNPSLTISYYQLSLNNNTPAQPGNQQPAGRGQAYQNQNRGGGGTRGSDRGRGHGRGRGRSDDDTSDRGSMSGASVRTTGGTSDGPRTFHFDPCQCSVTTRVTPSTAYCPVCGDPCTGVTVQRDGTFTDFTGADDAIEEEPSNDDYTQQQTPSNAVPQPRSLPQPGPPVQPHVTGTPQPISVSQNSPPQVPTVVSPVARNDASQQMMEVENAQPASLVSRVTVRRLPNPPKPIGPRPAPEHPMDIDFPDLDDLDRQVESPTDSRATRPSGYGQDSAQQPTKSAFGDENTLPFVPPRRPSPMPRREGRIATSPTSPVDPFVQPSPMDSYDSGMQDIAPAPTSPVHPPPQHSPPPLKVDSTSQTQGYMAPSPQVNPFDDPTSATTPNPTNDTETITQEVVKLNKTNNLQPPSQWEGYDPSQSSGLDRSSAFRAGPGKAPRDPADSSSYASGAGNGVLPNSSSNTGYGKPDGGYPLRSRPQDNPSGHLRTGSDGTYGSSGIQGTEQLRAPSPLLVDPPNPSSPGQSPPRPPRRDPTPARPSRNDQYLQAPNGTGAAGGRGRTPSPSRPTVQSRPASATGTRPVTISENQGESHFGLSNLSFTPINYPDPNTALDKQYPTPEHLFQAMKFMANKPLIAEHIRTCGGHPNPRQEARRFAYEQDPTWSTTCMDRMYEVLQLKFAAYPGLETELLDTNEAELVLSSSDSFWGCGPDGTGQNHLGNLLMRLRRELLAALSEQIDRTGASS